jgi:LuxR family transcriptional regulator, maltose regulon positive regulatory protein
VWIRQGRLDEALAWARQEGLSADDDLTYLREFEHLTLARALPSDEAVRLLTRLLAAAEAGGRTGAVIETLVLLSLAHHRLGALPTALAALERALALAEPAGYVQVFADEGPPMSNLLRASARHTAMPPYVHRLLTALGGSPPVPQRSTPSGGLVEPLSQREHDVLRLLATDLSGPEIARRLVVSLNTVRTHTKNIYAKLGVNSRRAAVRRAEELDL